ncbi:hypothetical protein B4U80_07874 [Leptotrombidium deliense]|uniref:CAF17 C-terminal domain-containing protein n=1 Tax=Leptotrombidium deliense TaxID=299467 RepID=A0A443STY1_9ACAR|nr:hypothetical protein B4U80_07874 [Leptotrombidium deliense]
MKTLLSIREKCLFSYAKLLFRNERNFGFKATRLTDRSLLRISGSDSLSFLQTLLTNDIRCLEHVNCMFSYLLNVNSRILADLIVYRTNDFISPDKRLLVLNPVTKKYFGVGGQHDDKVLIECDSKLATALSKTLFAIKIRKDVKIEFATEYDIWAIYPNDENADLSRISEIASEDLIFVVDPRTHLLGYRCLTRLGTSNLQQLKNITQNLIDYSLTQSSITAYREFRYKLGVCEGIRDFGHARYSFYDCNGHLLNAGSNKKGLFVGEKMISKNHNLVQCMRPVMFENVDVNRIYPGSSLVSLNDERVLGYVQSVQGKSGIALLKISDQFDKEYKMFHPESETTVTTNKPLWWALALNRLHADQNYQIMKDKVTLNQISTLSLTG